MAVTIRRDDGSELTFGTDRSDVVEPVAQTSSGGLSARNWYLLNLSEDALSVAQAGVLWEVSNPLSYLSMGYWMHFSGDLLSLDITGGEIGTFVDGPELDLSAPPDMPISGTASYSGPANGIYAAQYGTDTVGPPGSTIIGEYFGTMDLTADFGANSIRGCVGCSGTAAYYGDYTDGSTGETYPYIDQEEVPTTRILFGDTPFDSNGTFTGTNVTIVDDAIPFTSSSGAWGGRFSNLPAANGDPRLVAGTGGGEAESAGGSSVIFIGNYVGIIQ